MSSGWHGPKANGEQAPPPTGGSSIQPPPMRGPASDNPAVKALTLALRDNAADLTEQDKAVREAEATLHAAQSMMTTLRTQREGLQAALAVLRSSVAPSARPRPSAPPAPTTAHAPRG